MTCLECELEQAVADAGTCARCGARLPGAGHPSDTFTGPDGAELRADDRGIHVRGPGDALGRLMSWDKVGWFRDGWHAPESEQPSWTLQIVLAEGRVEQVTETRTAAQAPPELLALVRRAAAAHSVPAVLTGGEVHHGLPGDDRRRGKAGLYYDPAGEPGLREWTGTEWSPFLQADPGASGRPGQENGLARIWSPLSPQELSRHSRAVLTDTRNTVAWSFGCMSFLTMALLLIAVLMASDHLTGSVGDWLAGCAGGLWLVFAIETVSTMPDTRRRKRIAQALSAAATQAVAQDDPPASVEPPDSRTV